MLGNLVRDLGWLAETESDELQLTLEPCAVEQLLTAELARWQQQAEIDGIALSLQAPPDLPRFNLDPLRMSQALGNVIDNALRHTQAGGRVEVAATGAEGGRLTISVTDDGAGISSADLPHVVDRFYRADRSRSRRTGGAGLGLAIARAVVEAHGGAVSVSSDGPGRGTTVRFDLPPQQ